MAAVIVEALADSGLLRSDDVERAVEVVRDELAELAERGKIPVNGGSRR
jgi:hypothetical protein